MKILILTVADHLYANHIVTHLLQTRQVAATWESGVLYQNKTYAQALQYYLKQSGIDYVVSQGIKQTLYKYGSRLSSVLQLGQPGKLYYSYHRLAKSKNIPVTTIHNINGQEAHQQLEEIAPDLIISAYFNQIIKPPILAIPPLGCINGHPAPLPKYRGVSPIFWALADNADKAGFTIHKIDPQIDTGSIYAQFTLPISPTGTEHSIYWELTRESLQHFDRVLDAFEQQGKPPTVKAQETESSYYSLPKQDAVKKFRKNGRRFFRYRELLGGTR